MKKQFFEDKRPHNGLNYNEYNEMIEKLFEESSKLDDSELAMIEYTKMNIHRSNRIHKTYKPGEEITNQIKSIDKKQIWMVVTEEWCGDSAQNLPHFAMWSELNENIDLKILLRDDNLDIIDQYLTNETRSIPILVAFDEEGNELFKWGPRPKEAADLVKQLKSEGMEKKEFIEKLHLWYGRNRGKALETEFLSILKDYKKEVSEPV